MSIFPQSPLLSAVNEIFCFMDKTRVSDGVGGTKPAWTEGIEFEVAPNLDSSTEARIGEVQGLTSVYTFLVKKGTELEYHDVIKRKKDGKTFRVTSDGKEKQTPAISAMDMELITAEEWELV